MRRPLLARGARALSALVAAAAFVFAATAYAQDTTTSRISGTVKATDGGALPGVTVEVKNQDTGLVNVSVTDSDGFFRAINLPTGSYTVSATLDGFHPASTENVRLLLGVPVTVNFTLQSASVTETVTVGGTVPTVEITNTSASTTIQTEEIKALPISGRDFKNLVLLTPQVRIETIAGVLAKARKVLGPTGVFIAADVFGYTAFNDNDTDIGQRIEDMAPHLDYFSPMVYPSGYHMGIPGFRNPVSHSYEIVRESVRLTRKRTEGMPVQVRPWLQDFRDYAFDKRIFGVGEIQAQVRGAEEAGATGWMLWNPRNDYTAAALRPTPTLAKKTAAQP